MYPNRSISLRDMAQICKEFKDIRIDNLTYCSSKNNKLLINYSGIMGSWCMEDLTIGSSPMRAGDVQFFFQALIGYRWESTEAPLCLYQMDEKCQYSHL